jgi:hypothetical protein
VNVLGVDRHVDRSVHVRSVVIRNQEKIQSLITIMVVNVKNLDVLRSIVNVFKMDKNVEYNVNVGIVVMD